MSGWEEDEAKRLLGITAKRAEAAGAGDVVPLSGRDVVLIPEAAGAFVSMVQFNGQLLIGCERAIFVYVDGELRPIRFVDE